MENMKTIKTRILNKYDVLDNYKDFIPLKGEICIAEVATVQNPTEIADGFDGDTYDERPIVGIKVGDGEHTFAQLPWIQAVAGDVSAGIKTLTGVADIDAKIADIALADGRQLATIAELNKVSEDLGKVNTTVTDATLGNAALKNAIETLSSNTSSSLATKVDQSVAENASSEDKLVKKSTVTADINTAKTDLNTAIQGVQANVDTLANGQVSKNNENIGKINTKIGNVSIGTNENEQEKSITQAIADLQAVVGDSSEDLGSQVKDLQEQINTILENPDAEGAINSIKEFTDYITEHDTLAEGFLSDINGLKTKVDTGNLTVSGYVTEVLKDYALDEDLSTLSASVKELVANDDIEGIVSAVTQDPDTSKISITHKKITMDDMAQKDPTDSNKDYIFIFDCGDAKRDVEQNTEQGTEQDA